MKKKLAIVLMPVICALAALTVWGEGKPAGSLQLESANKTVQTTQTTVLDECNSSDEVQQILSQADQRRESIRNSETTIVKSNVFIKGETYTGTAYYVSNNGSDRNNGRSPRNAFATPAALERVNLKYGDAVFFERGSVWRGVTLLRRQKELHFQPMVKAPNHNFWVLWKTGLERKNGVSPTKARMEGRFGSITKR